MNERDASRKSRRMKSYFIILVTDIVILFAQHVLVLPKPRIRMCIMIFLLLFTHSYNVIIVIIKINRDTQKIREQKKKKNISLRNGKRKVCALLKSHSLSVSIARARQVTEKKTEKYCIILKKVNWERVTFYVSVCVCVCVCHNNSSHFQLDYM